MRYTVHMRVTDKAGSPISETSIPGVEPACVQDILDECTDRLERRGVRFHRVTISLEVERSMVPVQAERGLYRGLFPELTGLSP